MKANLLKIIAAVLLSIGAIVLYSSYKKIFGKQVLQDHPLYVSKHDNLDSIAKHIHPLVNSDAFLWVAQKKKFKTPKSGKYMLKKDMSFNEVINLLRSGNQTPVNISFNNQDRLEKLAERLSEQLDLEKDTLLEAMLDSTFLIQHSFTKATALGMYIPNTYEVYWNTSAEGLRDRMFKEYQSFWNAQRRQKANALKMSPQEVITLASIVQKETAYATERPIVAGLYINRLKRGIPLQADPTIIYAIKQVKGDDYVVKRVLNKDLKLPSPYNTYLNRGLPPSLIAMPDISSIEAVLNYQKHNYYYMCASIEKQGYHEFSTSLSQHNKNAQKYQKWLNKQGIRR